MLSQKQLSARRTAAKVAGSKTYLGNTCSKHPELNGLRVIWTGSCADCYRDNGRARMRRWMEKNPDRVREIATRTKARNAVERRQKARDRYARDPERSLARHKRWRSKPEVAARLRRNAEHWRQNNLPRKSAAQSRRKAGLRRATLGLGVDAFVVLYENAADITASTGIKHVVDHVIPLRGKFVSGLHVPWNMRVIPERVNIEKSNRISAATLDAIAGEITLLVRRST